MKRWVLAATILGSSMAFIDTTVVNVALPIMQRALHADVAAAQWIIDAYLLVLSALILQTCEAYPQIFLRELRDALQEQGVEVSTSSLSRFFARHAITRKKGRRTRLSRSGRT